MQFYGMTQELNYYLKIKIFKKNYIKLQDQLLNLDVQFQF